MSRWSRSPTTPWSVWKFHWLANHKILAALRRARVHARGSLLDVGCGARPFEPQFAGTVSRYWGVDLAASPYLGDRRPDAFACAERLPFRDATFDTVLGLSMITYTTDPQGLIDELHRVLKPGGVLLLEFTQMAPLHDEPHDYFRYTRFGAGHLLERSGFVVGEAIPIGGLWARVGLSLTEALNRVNRGPTRIVTELPVRVLYVVLQLVFDVLDRMFLDRREVLANLVVARKR